MAALVVGLIGGQFVINPRERSERSTVGFIKTQNIPLLTPIDFFHKYSFPTFVSAESFCFSFGIRRNEQFRRLFGVILGYFGDRRGRFCSTINYLVRLQLYGGSRSGTNWGLGFILSAQAERAQYGVTKNSKHPPPNTETKTSVCRNYSFPPLGSADRVASGDPRKH